MEEAITLFWQVFDQIDSIEVYIAELKRKGFNQFETIKVLMKVSAISIVEADDLVYNSLALSN